MGKAVRTVGARAEGVGKPLLMAGAGRVRDCAFSTERCLFSELSQGRMGRG